MAKNDFPWFRRQIVKISCRLLFYVSHSFLFSKVFNLLRRRLMHRYEDSLFGEFPTDSKRAVIYLACDEIYYQKFGIHLVRSGIKNAPGFHIHLHVNGLSDHYQQVLEVFSKSEGQGLFSYTWDNMDFSKMNGNKRWYYLASVRFVRLYQLVQSCHVPVLSLDADGVIVKSLQPKLSELQATDIGIYLRPTNTLDWRKVLASALLIMNTEEGHSYIRDVALMIAWLLKKPLPYHIDQLVIYYMWGIYQSTRKGFRYFSLTQDMADWECREDSYIWSAKGDRKYMDKVFRRAAEA